MREFRKILVLKVGDMMMNKKRRIKGDFLKENL